MATLYAQANMTWNGSSWSANSWNTVANGSGSNQTPVDGDKLDAQARTITYTGNFNFPNTVLTGTTGGHVCSTNGCTITVAKINDSADTGGSGYTFSSAVAAGSSVNLVAREINQLTGANGREPVRFTGEGTLNVTVTTVSGFRTTGPTINQFSGSGVVNLTATNVVNNLGSANNSYGIITQSSATGTINATATNLSYGSGTTASSYVVTNASAGGTINLTIGTEWVSGNSANSQHVCFNVYNGTINVTGDLKGAASFTGQGANNLSTGTLNVYGKATAGDNGHGAVNAAGGIMYVREAKGGDYGYGQTTGKTLTYGAVNTSTGKLTVRKVTAGTYGAAGVSGHYYLEPDVTNAAAFCRSDTGAVKTLIDVANAAGVLPAESDVRYDTVFNLGANKGSLRVPAAGSVDLGVLVDNTVGTAVLSADSVRTALGLVSSSDLTDRLTAIHNKTTNLPAVPAAVGSAMTLTAVAFLGSDGKVLLSTDSQSGVTIPTVTTLTNAPTVPSAQTIAQTTAAILLPVVRETSGMLTSDGSTPALFGDFSFTGTTEIGGIVRRSYATSAGDTLSYDGTNGWVLLHDSSRATWKTGTTTLSDLEDIHLNMSPVAPATGIPTFSYAKSLANLDIGAVVNEVGMLTLSADMVAINGEELVSNDSLSLAFVKFFDVETPATDMNEVAKTTDIRSELATELALIDTNLDAKVSEAGRGTGADAGAVASAVRAELATELGRIDTTVGSRLAASAYTAPLNAAQTRSAVGLSTANLDTQLSGIVSVVNSIELDYEEAADAVRAELTPELARLSVCATVQSTGEQLAAFEDS